MNLKKSAKLIRAVLFDFDGTLTEPGSIDFNVIRGAIGCPNGIPVLEFIASMTSPAERAAASRTLEDFEAEAARQSCPNAGAEDVIAFLRARGLKLGIISRNSFASIATALKNFKQVRMADFPVILSRDDPFSPKPSPAGILAASEKFGVPVEQVLVVGDFVFDVEAGAQAGALTAFLTNRDPSHSCPRPSDFTLDHLDELKEIVLRHSETMDSCR